MTARFYISNAFQEEDFKDVSLCNSYENDDFIIDKEMLEIYKDYEVDFIFNFNDKIRLDGTLYVITEKQYNLDEKIYEYILDELA